MKTKLTAIIMLLLISLFLSSCLVTSRDFKVDISCDTLNENPTSLQNDFEMEIGDKLRVNLCSNPSTGFKWEYEVSGDNVIKEEDYDFEEPESDVIGAPGKEVWTFEAVSKGTAKIYMKYSRPWKTGAEPEWTYDMNITVQ